VGREQQKVFVIEQRAAEDSKDCPQGFSSTLKSPGMLVKKADSWGCGRGVTGMHGALGFIPSTKEPGLDSVKKNIRSEPGYVT
jgi:hypothetical protein